METTGEPRAHYRPRQAAFLQIYRDNNHWDFPLDSNITDLPPALDRHSAKPKKRARIDRVAGGYKISPVPGFELRVNNQVIKSPHLLRGGDEIRLEGFYCVYTTARAEMSVPIALLIWPPEGPAVEIRSHRTQFKIGSHATCDIIVEDDSLNEVHCMLTRYKNGTMQLEDLGSNNGVYIDGVQVSGAKNLRDGAAVHIGNTALKAWAKAPASVDIYQLSAMDYDDSGPSSDSNSPLQPYAMTMGPDYTERQGRTMDDEVPTRLEHWGQNVGVRPQRKSPSPDGYIDDDTVDDRLPEWAPLPRNKPQRTPHKRDSSRFIDADTDLEWADRDKGGLTLVHSKDRPIKPRRDK